MKGTYAMNIMKCPVLKTLFTNLQRFETINSVQFSRNRGNPEWSYQDVLHLPSDLDTALSWI